jgi:hypothetical protein
VDFERLRLRRLYYISVVVRVRINTRKVITVLGRRLFSGSETLRNVGLASIALSVLLFGLVIWHGLVPSFIVNDCNGYCTNAYDYSPLNPPVLLGLVLFSFGTLTVSMTGLLNASKTPKGDRAKSGLTRLEVLVYSYIAVPVATVLVLLALANMQAWSGSPATYVGPCRGIAILPPGIREGWCYTLIWDGLWIDTLLYTITGYGIIILLTMIPKMRKPYSAFPELDDRPSFKKT